MDIPEQIQATREALIEEIDDFLVERRITASTFGRLAVNDGKFVTRLRAGENMTTSTFERAHEFIRAERARAAA